MTGRSACLILAVFAGTMAGAFGLPLLLEDGMPALAEALAPYSGAIGTAGGWFLEWWWLSAITLVLFLFWKFAVFLVLVAADRMARVLGAPTWTLAVWVATTIMFGAWRYVSDGLAHALVHVLLSAAIYAVLLAVVVGVKALRTPRKDTQTGNGQEPADGRLAES